MWQLCLQPTLQKLHYRSPRQSLQHCQASPPHSNLQENARRGPGNGLQAKSDAVAPATTLQLSVAGTERRVPKHEKIGRAQRDTRRGHKPPSSPICGVPRGPWKRPAASS
ncbi:hypothetical protein NDU88_009942 [Pleurodeles waltl]|uniref:Uncharacterized protein n=1 Tax=Pleurodeles waltl TaxID=8319 RepID=A0AAV7RXQ3_PLEWA|nr:hypothetical protein NDU88_009942 [Pleurodeles waltl]